MQFRDFLKDYLTFSKKERNGVFILAILIIALIFYLFTAPLFIHNGKTDFTETKRQISLLASAKKETHDTSEHDVPAYDYLEKKEQAVFPPFDPNTINREGWRKMGISGKLANAILNYRAKGGKFRKKEDLKKIYTLDEKTYDALERYICIQEDPRKIPEKSILQSSAYRKKTSPEIIELNRADSAGLIALKGIGPYYAGKIIRYREQLGGYVATKQLLELYKMQDSTYLKIQDRISADTLLIRKLNLNIATAEELALHPYIRKNLARVIVNYRNQHGPFKNPEELANIRSINQELYIRIRPYILIQ